MAMKKNEIQKQLAMASLVITVFLLVTIIAFGGFLGQKREDYIGEQFDRMYQDFSSMQTLFLLSDTYDSEMACLAFDGKIKELDLYIWELGQKIDKYRTASEEFYEDQYYLQQKMVFNENELNYLLLMKKMAQQCNFSKQIVLFFYQNAVDCKKCDDQSFILTDINLLDDENNEKEVAIFSFDMDLNLTSLNVLARYYDIEEYPCVIINDQKHCGIQDRDFILNEICTNEPDLDICYRYKEGIQI